MVEKKSTDKGRVVGTELLVKGGDGADDKVAWDLHCSLFTLSHLGLTALATTYRLLRYREWRVEDGHCQIKITGSSLMKRTVVELCRLVFPL